MKLGNDQTDEREEEYGMADEGESREIQIEIDDDEQEDKPILQHL